MNQTALFVLLVLCSGKKLCRSGEGHGLWVSRTS